MDDFYKLTKRILSVIIPGLTLACGVAIIPSEAPGRNTPAGYELMQSSLEAHGGSEAWSAIRDVNVRYEGEWLSIVNRLQPILSDSGYRVRSEERLILGEGTIAQSHSGPEGSKYVLRTKDDVSVWYAGEQTEEENVLAASALVADAYEMFLTGPRFFLQRNALLERLGAVMVDGTTYDTVLVTLRPGFGLSEEDRAIVYLNPETRMFERVRFTLNGLESTRGAEVEVVLGEHREIDGILWPTRFYERVESPVSLPAHRWELRGLDTNRDPELSDLEGPEFSDLAALPAASIQDSVPSAVRR